MVSKYGHFMLPQAFPDKLISDIDFPDETVVQFDVKVVKTICGTWKSTYECK